MTTCPRCGERYNDALFTAACPHLAIRRDIDPQSTAERCAELAEPCYTGAGAPRRLRQIFGVDFPDDTDSRLRYIIPTVGDQK